MVLSSNSADHRPRHSIGIQVITFQSFMEPGVEERPYEPADLISKSSEEICFEIDHALPADTRIAVRLPSAPADSEAVDDIFEVNRGGVRSCREVQGTHGSRYTICMQVFETVLQAEVVASRFGRH